MMAGERVILDYGPDTDEENSLKLEIAMRMARLEVIRAAKKPLVKAILPKPFWEDGEVNVPFTQEELLEAFKRQPKPSWYQEYYGREEPQE
jgi:hypothetical protein